MQPPQRITEDFAIENIGSLVSKRIKAGLSIKELSLLTGVSKLSLYRYENGTLPSGKNYNKIAKYFGWELVDNAKDVNSGRKKTVRDHITEKEFHNTLLEIRRKEEEVRLLLEARKKSIKHSF